MAVERDKRRTVPGRREVGRLAVEQQNRSQVIQRRRCRVARQCLRALECMVLMVEAVSMSILPLVAVVLAEVVAMQFGGLLEPVALALYRVFPVRTPRMVRVEEDWRVLLAEQRELMAVEAVGQGIGRAGKELS